MFDPFLTEKQILRKLGGDKITAKKYTFDGNTEGRIVVPVSGSDSFVKISDDMPDLHKLADLAYSSGGHATADALTIQDVKPGDNTLYGAVGMIALGGNAPYVVVVTDTASSPIPETGLYTIMVGGSFWISSIEFAETIVPIDQKYLGGVCLPVVELETVLTAGTETELPETDAAKLDVVVRTDYPIVVKFTTADVGAFTMLLGKVVFSDDMFAYSGAFPFGDQTYKLTMLYEGGWVVMLSVV
jgi:hypothetical protein